jgi:hypothetical protein
MQPWHVLFFMAFTIWVLSDIWKKVVFQDVVNYDDPIYRRKVKKLSCTKPYTTTALSTTRQERSCLLLLLCVFVYCVIISQRGWPFAYCWPFAC